MLTNESLERDGLFHLCDGRVPLLPALSGNALPRQIAPQQVDEEETDTFEVISPTLLFSLVSCQRRVPRSARQALSILPGNMLTLLVLIALGESEVNCVDSVHIVRIAVPDQEVVRLDVTMQYVLVVDSLHMADEL